MTIAAYQHVFARMVASSSYRAALVERPDEVLSGTDLSERERRRLLAIAVQPGMRVSTAIHRANRLAPIEQTLPFTCVLLGDRLGDVVNRYWSQNLTENLRLPAECERFATFLLAELAVGALRDPYLEEVIRFERACTDLRFSKVSAAESLSSGATGLPALLRIVRFTHHPVALLDALVELRRPLDDVETGDFYLVVDCRRREPEFRLLDQRGVSELRSRGWLE